MNSSQALKTHNIGSVNDTHLPLPRFHISIAKSFRKTAKCPSFQNIFSYTKIKAPTKKNI
jgi:hypothetical protein